MKPSRQNLSAGGIGWILRMAWRDSRGKRLLLVLFTFSVVFGIGAIVAIHSLRENLLRIVDEQARSLLGADVVFQTRSPPSDNLDAFIDSLPGEKVSERRFRSMAAFPDSGESRFVQVRAINGPLPFYGEMETVPSGSDPGRTPLTGQAIVEESLMLQLELESGDLIRIGNRDFTIAAALVRMAGESAVTGFFAPRIYISLQDLDSTGLVQQGSIIRYRTSVGVGDADREALVAAVESERETLLTEDSVRIETVADRRESLEEILNNLLDFLNLIGFVALLLGGIGITGAVNVYLQGKRETIAILRCLGSGAGPAFAIYLLQMQVFGMTGAIAGTGLGIGVQFIIPELLATFLPFPVEMQISPVSVVTGLVFGWLIVTASALIPLIGIRRISPLQAIRAGIEQAPSALRDPLAWLAGAFMLASLLAFTVLQSRRIEFALGFVGGLLVALGILAGIAALLRLLMHRLRPSSMGYAGRMALSNLYRPNNRTLLLVTTMGMGVLLVNTLIVVREGLLNQVEINPSEEAANVILLDIQPDQRVEVTRFLAERNRPPQDVLPIVTMRVSRIKDRPLADWRDDPESPVSDWIYTWEFRNTYRDTVLDNAEVSEGTFIPSHDGSEPFPVSLSANVVEDMGVGIGDSITWDVQGVEIESVVSSIRDVRWQAGRQNFNVVFPLNTIEPAPTVYAVSVKTDSRLETANLQADLVGRFPNVSLIDLSLVFQSIEEILGKASFVIKFMAGFTVATGLVVLAGALLSSRYQRIRESVLFRTLGATRAFIRSVLVLEFVLLGMVASLSGLILSQVASWILLEFVFEVQGGLQILSGLGLLAVLITLTVATGLLTSRGIATQPPLVVLRKE